MIKNNKKYLGYVGRTLEKMKNFKSKIKNTLKHTHEI